ncbi:MAG: hypothetical protein Q9164_004868, partial [Protoblastenia rupestris]
MPRVPLQQPPPPSTKEDSTSVRGGSPAGEEPPEKKPRLDPEDALSQVKPSASIPTIEGEPSGKIERSSTQPEQPNHSTLSTRDTDTFTALPSIAPPANTLPPQLLVLLQNIQSTLTTTFPYSPPYTAQRLAELLLHPTRHYRTLPSFLRALDRIVSVASSLSEFPLPTLPSSGAPMTESINMINGYYSPELDPEREDKDFIGGAELTEIPWLRNAASPTRRVGSTNANDLRTESTRVIDGPNGAGSVETVTVSANGVPRATPISQMSDEAPQPHGISQGELLRQEQEAGVVTVPSATPNGRVTRSTAAASAAASRAVGIPTSAGEDEDMGVEPNTGEEEP